MMRLLLLLALYALGLALAFLAGIYWCRWSDPVPGSALRLRNPLLVLAPQEGQENGALPAGTLLYRVRDPFAKNMVMYRADFNVIVDDEQAFFELEEVKVDGRKSLPLRSTSWLRARE